MKSINYLGTVPENYDASDVIGTRMTATETTQIFDYIYADGLSGELLGTIPKGAFIGVVNSYLVKGGQLWWEIKNPSTIDFNGVNYFYVKHDKSNLTVNEEDIYQSPEEIEAAKPTLTETIVSTILKVVTIGAIAYSATKLLTGVATAKINNKKAK